MENERRRIKKRYKRASMRMRLSEKAYCAVTVLGRTKGDGTQRRRPAIIVDLTLKKKSTYLVASYLGSTC